MGEAQEGSSWPIYYLFYQRMNPEGLQSVRVLEMRARLFSEIWKHR